MAKSNRDRVGEVIDALRDGLEQYIIREYKMVYKREFAREIDAVLTTDRHELPRDAFENEQSLMDAIDTHGWLNLMWRRWNDVFSRKLGHAERSYVSELMTARNDWAHQKSFSNDDAQRAADTATRLLKAIGSPKQASVTQAISNELMRLRFEAEAKKSKKQTGSLEEKEMTTKAGLKPWRFVVNPHPDVAGGRYMQAEFAADIAQVQQGTADAEYSDPKEFFRRTYLTEGLRELLATGIKRLWGKGGDPVVQLQTSFGGGKTHSMLALWHLVSGKVKLSDIPGGESISELVGDADLPEANRAVLVGTAFSATNATEHPDATTHTLWGELAYQLGGVEGYKIVEDADLAGANPGADVLVKLMETFGPALIIIDELVAYARNLYKTDGLPAGSFDTVMSFAQSLTEATRRSTDSILLISIPESNIEIGGEGGQAALEILSNTIGRIESIWKPVMPTESFEIVRRRLFSSDIDYGARDAVIRAFAEMYRNSSREFPAKVLESDYVDRLKDAYPIHPELFDTLYEEWSSLERFQRTRGVLRLMAAVIHELWSQGDQSLLIMPGSIPLDEASVRNEMLRYLPEGWSPVVDRDIDGATSRPFLIDNDVPALGRLAASRRVARAVFAGSAPSSVGTTGGSVRGVEETTIRLSAVQPGEQPSVFGDALKRMSNMLTYLYSDGSRYWYDTRPTVNKIARDRAQSVSEGDIEQEVVQRLRKVRNTANVFTGAHVAPSDTSDVVDEPRTRVVVLDSYNTFKRNDSSSEAMNAVAAILESRGNSPRIYRNMLVFVVADKGDTEALNDAVRDYLAWKSIVDEEEHLDLTASDRRQARSNLERATETVDLRLQTAYNWLIVPMQTEATTGEIEWQALKMTGEDNFYERAARKLKQSEYLITEWSPDNLRMELDNYLWRDKPHLGLKQLWEYLATYCYLPRLRDHNVLVEAIHAGVGRLDAPFAYATGVDSDGSYTGLTYRQLSSIYFDSTSVLVRPEVAEEQLSEDQVASSPDEDSLPENNSTGNEVVPSQPKERRFRRYHGAVDVNAQRINREMPMIVEEVIQHLTSLSGCDVNITLEISARLNEGFDEAIMRTVNENSRTLKFKNSGFEEE